MSQKASIAMDYAHNNKLTLEASSYAEFTQFLFNSGYRLGKIQAGFDSLKKLEIYNMIILSTPNNADLEEKEIDVLEEYVRKGGNLLIVSSSGGDYNNRTNLNMLAQRFGFEFNTDEINDSMNYVNLQKRPLLEKLKPHIITEQIKKVVFSSACSLNILDFMIEDDDNIKLETLIEGGLNCWRKVHKEKEWIEEDCPKKPLLVSVEYFKGRVVAFGSLSIFSSLGREYGYSAFDNDVLLANIFRWLTTGIVSEGKVITINLNLDLFYWANAIIEEQGWKNISDMVNLSLKYFKDNYKDIIEEIKQEREERVKKRKKYKKEKAEEISEEDKILELVPTRKKEDLDDIMSELESITGEKYEYQLEDEEEGEEKEEEEEAEEKVSIEEEEDNGDMDNSMKEKMDEVEKELKEELEGELEKEIEKEEKTIMEQVQEEVEKEFDTKLEEDKAGKLKSELGKKFGGEIEQEKQRIRASIKEDLKSEKKKFIDKIKQEIKKSADKEGDFKTIIEQARKELEQKHQEILKRAREEMEKERTQRVKQIKQRELEIIKDNKEFLEDVLDATDMFSGPILDNGEEEEEEGKKEEKE
ncbi:MAG: hypothetical protein EU544_03175 [Promethearchaeota archaeon]|nr:MAG: hypothetical protein EU544_03175 [Candidatus Lokiarchaeota archaeon]